MKRPEVERMRALLVEAITTLCRSGLQYNANLKVEGLIGITLDEADIILVNLNKSFGSGMEEITSPSKSQRGHDRLAMSDDEISHDSFSQEPSSPRERRKERQRKRRESAAAQEAKRSRMTPTKDHSSDSSSQFHISNTYSLTSPDSHGGGTVRKSSEADPHDTVPSASSVESALTTTSRNMSDSNAPSRPESASNQDSRVNNQGSHSAQKSETVVKIEIDSDPEVEEVKVEPAPSQSCSLAQVHSYHPQSSVSDTSLSTTFPPDLSQAIPSLSASDVQGELFASQLPPEFSAAAQSDPNAVPVGMFSNTLAQPVAGPSGLNMSHAGGAPFVQGDALAARAGQLQAGQKTKTFDIQQMHINTGGIADLQTDQLSNATYSAENQAIPSTSWLTCTFCPKTFSTKYGLKSHERSHKGQYRYICDICSRGFMVSSHLEGHKNQHKNLKPYRCSLCNTGFAYKSARNRHAAACVTKLVKKGSKTVHQ